MTTEAEKKLESAEHREDRKDSEEMPVWAADMMTKMDSLHGRMDAMEKGGFKADRKDSEEEEREEEKAERKDAEEPKAEEKKEDKKDERKDESEKEEAHKAAEELEAAKKREDAARADASAQRENRELKGKLAALEQQIGALYKEPSFEDRNAMAEARARADATYQAVTGRPASDPLPGEAPIAYRKRMADGLRKFSAKFKEQRVDSLTGAAFELVESQIYADAQTAAKRPDILPAGQLRGITRNDSGHVVTEYIGDAEAAWAPFSQGAALNIKFTKPERH
ncbi:MAG: hypothetical protein KGL39_46935 [Patescibacteria group bacterium]|nr:hypothetical protein [Patescibacteria group bacterium]